MMRIETTYLIKELPALTKCKHEEIEQGYLVEAEDASRVRKKGDEYSITHKLIPIPGDKSYREYIILPLRKDEFAKIWSITKKRLKKTRYYYSYGDSQTELRIDVFAGPLKGLALAELIFPDENEKRNFLLPSWLGREITSESWASNQFLAGKKFSDIKKLF